MSDERLDRIDEWQTRADRRFDELRELIERWFDPLEAAVRDHSRRIAALAKKRR